MKGEFGNFKILFLGNKTSHLKSRNEKIFLLKMINYWKEIFPVK